MPDNILDQILARNEKDLQNKRGRTLPTATHTPKSNEVFHDDIKRALRENRGDLNVYFRNYKSQSSIEFTHSYNSPSLAQVSYSITTSNSLDYSASSLNISGLSKVKDLAARDFCKVLIKPSINREKQTISFLNQYVSDKITDHSSALNYFNNQSLNPIKIPDLYSISKDEIDRYEAFNNPKNSNYQDKTALINTALSQYEDLKIILEKTVLDNKQFIGRFNIFFGTIEKITGSKSNIDVEQLRKSGKTWLEIVEIARQILIWQSYKNEGKNFEVEIISSGSQESTALKYIWQQYTGNKTSITADDLSKIINNFITNARVSDYIVRKTDSEEIQKRNKAVRGFIKKIKLGGMSAAGAFGKWGESETDDTVADITHKFIGKDPSGKEHTRVVLTDAKVSADDRYTPSTGITSSLKSTFNSMHSQDLAEEAMSRLITVLSFILFLIVTNKIKKEDFEKNDLTTLVTYAFLGSNEFLSHYRNYTPEDSSGFSQPDFLRLISGYIWYSEFFKVMYYIYFLEEASGGTKVSLRFKDLIDSKGTVLKSILPDSIINEIDAKRSQINTMEDLKKINFTDESIKKYFDAFMSYKIQYKFDRAGMSSLVKIARKEVKCD